METEKKEYSPKKRDYNLKYAEKRLKRIPLDVQKDFYDRIVDAAKVCTDGKVNTFIKLAIEEKLNRM